MLQNNQAKHLGHLSHYKNCKKITHKTLKKTAICYQWGMFEPKLNNLAWNSFFLIHWISQVFTL